MEVEQIKEILAKKGYKLVKVVPFKKSDRIRWQSSSLNVSLNLGKKIEDLTVEEFERWVL